MTDKDNADALAVFTARSPERIAREGGSQAWVLNPARAKLCNWLVCTQNRHNPDHEFSDATAAHASAFLVGQISAIREADEHEGGERWMVEISEFARVSVPDVWKQWRNPVRYTTLEELGIDPSTLHFEPMPSAAVPSPSSAKGAGTASAPAPAAGLTIAEAKKALAVTFGVKPDAVEITIRG